MFFFRRLTNSSESVSGYSNLTRVLFLVVSSILIAVNASPLPQNSLSVAPDSLQISNSNGQYTPELYPGQKGYYEPNQDVSSTSADILPSETVKHVTSQSGGSSEIAYNSILDNPQLVQPNQDPGSLNGVFAAPSSDSNSNKMETQKFQQPDIQAKQSKDLILNTSTSSVGVNSASNDNGVKHTYNTYQQYIGDGSTSAGWPDKTQWMSFEDMFKINSDLMSRSCSYWNLPLNSEAETQAIKQSIQDVASHTHVDSRMILAITMQESKGCVRVPSTSYGVLNPGLMQSYKGDGSCNENGEAQTPCPSSMISRMINDGAAGTSSGPGLLQIIKEIPGNDAPVYYKAARIYNSGSVDSSGDLGKGIAVHCFASDIANRLIGWVEEIGSKGSGCNLDS